MSTLFTVKLQLVLNPFTSTTVSVIVIGPELDTTVPGAGDCRCCQLRSRR
jgi:hypothetical protein